MKFTILLALTAAGASVAAVGNKSGLRSIEDQVSNGYEPADFFGLPKFAVPSTTVCFAHHCDHALDF